MPSRKPRYLRVIYLDRDQKTGNVSEVICDDTAVTNRTCKLQKAGRHINITTTKPQVVRNNVPSIESLLQDLPDGYKHDPKLSW